MKTYIYTVYSNSAKRSYNRTVNVYRIKNNVPVLIGYDDEINTASYKGDYAVACSIINKVDGHKLANNGYKMASKNIQIFSI